MTVTQVTLAYWTLGMSPLCGVTSSEQKLHGKAHFSLPAITPEF